MANEQAQGVAGSSGDTLENWIAARQRPLSIALLVLAALFAALALTQLILQVRSKSGNVPIGAWAAALSLLWLFGGLYLTFEQGSAQRPGLEGRFRLLALGLGGVAGLLTFLLGLWLPLGPWSVYFVPGDVAKATSAPLLKVWRENWWRIAVCGLSILGGLGMMFASLQLARSVERASAGMRRLLYGYNAALTGLLLLAILGLLNVLSYVHLWPFTLFGQQLDWTPGQIHTLSEHSINVLQKEVDGDVEFVVLMPFNTIIAKELESLFNNMREYKSRISVVHYSPDASKTEYHRALAKYGNVIEKASFQEVEAGLVGIVVVYRKDSKEDVQFVPYRQLLDEDNPPTQRNEEKAKPRFIFKGESQLILALQKLADKKPAKIVFTRGHGEPGSAEGRRERADSSLSELKRMLSARGNYEFKEITLGPDGVEGGKGFEEAEVVVVARPTEVFAPKALDALRQYIKPIGTSKKGKLIVLLSTEVRGTKMLQTGLEGLLREFNVEVSDKRLLSASPRPEMVLVTPDPSSPLGGILRVYLGFRNARQVDAAQAGTPGVKVDRLLVTTDFPVWEEPNLTASGSDLLAKYAQTEFPEDQRPRSKVPVAVAVSESNPRSDLPPGHVPVDKGVPRLVVFGDNSWLANEAISRQGSGGADLFANCLSWLRGKAVLGRSDIEDKERNLFTLKDKTTSEDVSRLTWLPLALILISVVGLGGGIWVARRR
jgi:hypothetical protein